jgi:hypothetical protein
MLKQSRYTKSSLEGFLKKHKNANLEIILCKIILSPAELMDVISKMETLFVPNSQIINSFIKIIHKNKNSNGVKIKTFGEV